MIERPGKSAPSPVPAKGKQATDLDRHVSARLRERRIMSGMTQPRLAEALGVTFQQVHKYEVGSLRIHAGRLYQIAQALGVEIGYFYEGVESLRDATTSNQDAPPTERLLVDLAQHFLAITNRNHQKALCGLVRRLTRADV